MNNQFPKYLGNYLVDQAKIDDTQRKQTVDRLHSKLDKMSSDVHRRIQSLAQYHFEAPDAIEVINAFDLLPIRENENVDPV